MTNSLNNVIEELKVVSGNERTNIPLPDEALISKYEEEIEVPAVSQNTESTGVSDALTSSVLLPDGSTRYSSSSLLTT